MEESKIFQSFGIWGPGRMVKCGHDCPQSLAAKETIVPCASANMVGLWYTRGSLFMSCTYSPSGSTCSISDLPRTYHLWVLSGDAYTVVGGGGCAVPQGSSSLYLWANPPHSSWQDEHPSTLFHYKNIPLSVYLVSLT